MIATILYDNHNTDWADLAPRMVEFTKFKLYPNVATVTQDIHSTLMETEESWAVVFAAGNVIHKPEIVQDIVNHCIQEKSPLSGHILNFNGYYQLHPQFFCVNVKIYKQWAKGLEPQSLALRSVEVERSKENIHDDYTPLWIKPSGDAESDISAPDGFASRFIAWLMSNGHSVINIPHEIRNNKFYSYVDYNHEDIRLFLKDNKHNALELGANQFLEYIRRNLRSLSQGFYPVNTEPFTRMSEGDQNISMFAGVCGGIKPSIIINQDCFALDTKVILFDISGTAIEWQKWLRSHWDGRRDTFEQVFEEFKTQFPESLPQFFGHMGILGNLDWVLNTICDEQEFIKKWNRWLMLDVEYCKLNLLDDADQEKLINKLTKPSYIWTSNLFYMDWQVLMHEPGYARECFNKFLLRLKSIRQPVVLENENQLIQYKI